MTTMTKHEMEQVEGAGFWGGFTCGVTIVIAASEGFVNPAADLLAIGTCGWAFE
jgi:hypothetical protein